MYIYNEVGLKGDFYDKILSDLDTKQSDCGKSGRFLFYVRSAFIIPKNIAI